MKPRLRVVHAAALIVLLALIAAWLLTLAPPGLAAKPDSIANAGQATAQIALRLATAQIPLFRRLPHSCSA